jgi:hypothetical protein
MQPVAIPCAGHGVQREAGQGFVALQILNRSGLWLAAGYQQDYTPGQY